MSYNRNLSNPLLDFIIESRGMKNDAELCRVLGVAAPIVSKIRHKRNPVSAEMILCIHEKLGMPVADIRALIPKKES